GNGSLPILDIKNVLASKPEKLEFVLPGLLAGTVGAIVSTGGVGKSAYVLAKMKQVSKQGRAVYLSLEDNIDMLKHRLHSLYNSS
ncbi:AAA family ATPase, partial [Guyparkeria sp. 1SP6A2]|nr:AAA family ATPase [Guyparkeria sp. 1SP6A2]